MNRKSLNLTQSRFLGDLLKMEKFEESLVNSPLDFLKDLVKNYRLNVPFHTVDVPAHVKKTGKVKERVFTPLLPAISHRLVTQTF